MTEYITIKIPAQTESELDGGETLRDQKRERGVSWLEFINGRRTAHDVLEDVDLSDGMDADDVHAAVLDAVESALDDMNADIRQSSYQGAKEAMQEATQSMHHGDGY